MFFFGLQTCLNCGSFRVKQSLLCQFCQQALLDSSFCGIEMAEEKNLISYSLFDWVPQQSDLLSALILSLKGADSARVWKYWARIFWTQRVVDLQVEEKLLFIPAASSAGGRDHAFHFANALAELSGGKVECLLTKTTKTQQKEKKRDQRKELVIQSHVKIADRSPDTKVVLVDDVLTTGATALASYQVLGKPVNFEVWTLAKRSLSCGVSVDLL